MRGRAPRRLLNLALFDHPEPATPLDLTDSPTATTVEVCAISLSRYQNGGYDGAYVDS